MTNRIRVHAKGSKKPVNMKVRNRVTTTVNLTRYLLNFSMIIYFLQGHDSICTTPPSLHER